LNRREYVIGGLVQVPIVDVGASGADDILEKRLHALLRIQSLEAGTDFASQVIGRPTH